MNVESASNEFRRRYGRHPDVVAAAPGRVNLIGEHIDYNDGCVLPFAISQRIVAAASLDDSGQVHAFSAALDSDAAFSVDVNQPGKPSAWDNYVRGMVAGLRERGARIDGAQLWIGGDLPPGSGMSSSAALCVSTGLALANLANVDVSQRDMALMAQKSEHKFAGTPCGIMDQFASCFGRKDHTILLDCGRLAHEYVPFVPAGVAILAIPSGVRHDLAEGAYEKRVKSCKEALQAIAEDFPGTRSFRDVTIDMLSASRPRMSSETFKRARHVVTEFTRVTKAVGALRGNDLPTLGTLLWETHASLRDDYEVSCEEIEEMIRTLRRHDDVLGARMVGGGFGGIVLAMVADSAADDVIRTLESSYYLPRQIKDRPFVVKPSAGASVISTC
ncbi:MAG: galactokinase [Phycisphaerales bacterium]|nr:galactokinase [Phycisphaerales bacterium]MCB9863221.1 galactokinase [Phycisphaerales bacterium]